MPHILITGASSGLGAALAKTYAEKGVFLYLSGRNHDRLRSIAEECRQKEAEVSFECIDVSDSVAMSSWISRIDALHPLDLVIANAGISAGTAEGAESWTQTNQIFSTNVNGVINTLQPVMHHMQKRKKGQIAIVSSLAGIRGLPGAPAYSASKAAVRIYGEALRGLLAKDNVGITVIIPGYIETPMTQANDFPMPLLWKVEKAAKYIKKRLEKNPAWIAFPLSLYLLLRLLASMPSFLTDPLFAALPRKKPAEEL